MVKEITLSGLTGRTDYEIPLEGTDLKACMTLGAAGDMHRKKIDTIPDRRNYLKSHNIPFEKFYFTDQLHTQKVTIVTRDSNGALLRSLGVDGMITKEKGCWLSVTMADCLPIWAYDKNTRAFGVFHSGWKGTGIILNGIKMMEQSFGSKLEDLGVLIGPGIGSCCYNIMEDRARYFQENFGESSVLEKDGTFFLDLRKANINILKAYGIGDISVVKNCTACTPGLHSFRRQGGEHFKLMMGYMRG